MFINVIMVFLYTLLVVISLLLIGIVLIQPAKSGGMGAAFGGIGESVFGAKAGSHLTKATVVMTALFFVLALTLAALIGRTQSGSAASTSEMGKALKALDEKAKPAPAKPATTAPAKPAAPAPAKPAAPAPAKPATPAPAKPAKPVPAKPVPAKPAKPVPAKTAAPAPAK